MIPTLRDANSPIKLRVAELADTGLEESAALDRAIKMMSDDRRQQRNFNVSDAICDAERGSPAE
jgi:hypothetical protein